LYEISVVIRDCVEAFQYANGIRDSPRAQSPVMPGLWRSPRQKTAAVSPITPVVNAIGTDCAAQRNGIAPHRSRQKKRRQTKKIFAIH
jgi:hypothetical protein